MKNFFNLLIIFLLSNLSVFSQIQYDYGFRREHAIPVSDSSGRNLRFAWAGGLNSCQISEVDMNSDGIMDLFVFDKCGNRVLTFINQGIADSASYSYNYFFQKKFPEFNGWAHLLDYNCDGKNDIFAYTPAGIQVYKNTSSASGLNFTSLYPMLNSDMGGGSYSNIPVTYDDYPGIADIDGDGDLDILVFFGLGAYVEMHRNMSQETYGNCDTLLFKLRYHCWGDFAENSNNNKITLNITCPWRCNDTLPPDKAVRHTGSTMLAADLNNDNLTDLVLGDVDYFNLVHLTNGGTPDSAHMVSQDTLFPAGTKPVLMNSFPVPSFVDVNNDGKKDLIASPFTSNNNIPSGVKSLWLYRNAGSAQLPVFSFSKTGFLQSDMIETGSGAYPVLYDYNSDGLMDIIVGNYGYIDSTYYEFGTLKVVPRSQIAVLENQGTATVPEFQLVTSNFAALSSLRKANLIPTFADLDGDDKTDMICGESKGNLIFFRNTAPAGSTPVYDPPVFNYQGIDVGEYSAPFAVDLNGDSLTDLVVGRRDGLLSYYRNTGTQFSPVFVLINDSLGKVNVTDPSVSYYGYSYPCFFTDSSKLKLFVGSDIGRVYYFKDIETHIGGKFTATDSILTCIDSDSSVVFIRDGVRSGIAVGDLNGDGFKDMVVGNFSGGLNFYYGRKPKPYSGIETTATWPLGFDVFPNPARTELCIVFSDPRNGSVRAELKNLSGITCRSRTFAPGEVMIIPVHDLAAGIYICTVMGLGSNSVNLLGSRKVAIVK